MVQAFLTASESRLRVAKQLPRTAESKTAEPQAKVHPLIEQRNDLAKGNVQLADDNRRLSTLKGQLIARVEDLSNQVAKKAEENREYEIANAEFARQNESLVRQNRALTTRNEELAR